MQINSSAKNSHGAITSLTTLYNRHQTAQSAYTELSQQKAMDEITTLVKSLADYHQHIVTDLRQHLQDLPSVPTKPNQDMLEDTTSLSDADLASASTAAQTFKAYEEEILNLYKGLLDNSGLPEGIREQVQRHSERVTDVISKLERVSKTGIERVMSV
ncbi:MAG: hypothetical protein AAGJ82_06680 [Bacteroidota bacterium]